jgi:hypothetical protein
VLAGLVRAIAPNVSITKAGEAADFDSIGAAQIGPA